MAITSKSGAWRWRLLAPLAATAALAIGLVGCAADEGAPAETDDSPIVIGGTLGLTGIYSGPSAAYKIAYEKWAEDVNAAGGLLGREVELKIYDDESNPTVAQQLYQTLINEDEADILLAPYTTAVGGAVIPITERAGKLVVNAGFVGKEIHANAKYLINTYNYQDIEYPKPLFEWLKTLPENERPKTLAILTAQNPFTLVARSGYNGEGGVINLAKEAGIEILVDEEYDQAATDLTSLLQRVKSSGAEMLIALSLPNDAALIARTVEEVGYNPSIYCQCGSQVTSLPNWPDLGSAGVNVFATTTIWQEEDIPGLAEFRDYIFEKVGVPILPAYAPSAYTAGQIIQQAVEGTKSLDAKTLREYIGKNRFDTLSGNVGFNADGTMEFGARLLQYQKDGNVALWPTEVATGTAVRPLK